MASANEGDRGVASFGTANDGDRDGQRRRIRTRVSLLDISLLQQYI